MNIIKKIFKVISAGITALFLLTVACSFYSRWPVHLPNEAGNTDYIWEPNYPWILMEEGIAWGTTDADGYNNPRVVENPDVLILGSSHMESQNVPQDRNITSCLQALLGPEHRVYNKGISGHFFTKVCQYLRRNLELYETVPEYVIIETNSLSLSKEDVDSIMNHTVEFTPSYTSGLLARLQRNYFIRCAFHHLQNGGLDMLLDRQASSQSPQETLPTADPESYQRLFSYLGSLQSEFGTRLIIVYHPQEVLENDGSVSYLVPPEQQLFADSCRKNDIVFLDMEEAFRELSEKEHKVPHGFLTGPIGEGHLNGDGHRVMAQALAKIILQLEEDRQTCR